MKNLFLFLSLFVPSLLVQAQDNEIEYKSPFQKGHYYSPLKADKVSAYDLAARLEESTNNKSQRKGYAYDCFMLKDFCDSYYSGMQLQWERIKDYHFAFRTAVEEIGAQRTRQIIISWSSYSDGLEWKYFNTELVRSNSYNPFDIIASDDAAEAIKNYIHSQDIIDPNAPEQLDVFLYQHRNVSQWIQKEIPKDINFGATKYGVWVSGKLFWFDMQGNLI